MRRVARRITTRTWRATNDNLFLIDRHIQLSRPIYETIYGNPSLSGGIASFGTPEFDVYRPYPFYQHIYQLKHDFYSNYNSAQIEWDKASGMVTWGANYTFAKNLATASSYNNQLVDPAQPAQRLQPGAL